MTEKMLVRPHLMAEELYCDTHIVTHAGVVTTDRRIICPLFLAGAQRCLAAVKRMPQMYARRNRQRLQDVCEQVDKLA